MKTFCFLFFLFACFIYASAKKKTLSSEGGSTKLSTLQKKFKAFPLNALTDRNFSTYVTDRPRDYYAFLLFTATAEQYQCSVCVRSKQIVENAAKLYHEQYEFSKTPLETRLAFFSIEVDDARMAFNNMQLETVPRVYLIPPTTSESPKMKIGDYEIETRVTMDKPSAVLEEIFRVTNIKVEATTNSLPLLVVLGLVAILLALFVSSASYDVSGAVFWYQSPKLWVIVSAICFSVGVSGSIFCIIRSSPAYGASRKGLVLFAPQGRDQFLIEGIIIALLTLGFGVAGQLLMFSSRLKFPLLSHVLTLLSLSIMIVLGCYIFEYYTMKTGWYQLKETFPPLVWEWFKSSVKKNSGFLKRFVRLSEIWMAETKGFSAFFKKFKILIVDYALRAVSVGVKSK